MEKWIEDTQSHCGGKRRMFAPEIRANCRANEDYREWGRNEVHSYCDSVGPTSGKADITISHSTPRQCGCCGMLSSGHVHHCLKTRALRLPSRSGPLTFPGGRSGLAVCPQEAHEWHGGPHRSLSICNMEVPGGDWGGDFSLLVSNCELPMFL